MNIGPWQIILILVIVLIIFGAGKLPRVMGDIAKGVKSFKAGLKDEGDDSATVATRSPEESKESESADDKNSQEGETATKE
ncbi:MAG: twin-arginine translocase TatA/TatE family subunit [Alphaproteobacteria bacterium]|jgi:sec-independent protein translocase protein TatA|nr:twin-arginine translocase TatA/TatE family subunit [Alphaproteobacteria bacterium]MDP7122635.1 twin-arginine translocase TatA/TatE family subunit [Alphaproteobacteria bacterium]MDP7190275.1 twin-arginine translocase TatA/TatE family subunit [Alphaproteobacteria bacterium]HJO89536.1 twin-arginine translocase TatA/TatE family subunit [Alphaproteobacteria bacterium]|tara:strand:+ start:101 stop:343 length:243 start_codon:yes stop_codon:yes gene_type:complete